MERVSSFWVAMVLGIFLLSETSKSLVENDKQALMEFVKNVPHSRPLNWDEKLSVCKNWSGVTCSEDGSRVTGLRLPGAGFHGPVPENTLSRLSALQVLSLRSNGISGNFPSDFGNLKNLSYLYLQNNHFSGPLPLDLGVWENLTIVNLSNNGFNGSIPYSISGLFRLTHLDLSTNSFSGEIPDMNLPNLQFLNLSDNYLSGVVPGSLQRFPRSVFFANNVSFSLLDYSVSTQNLKPKNNNSAGELSERGLVGIILSVSVIGILGFGFLLLICCLRKKQEEPFQHGNMESPEKAISQTQEETMSNRLVFFEGFNYAFDLEDLLGASAEVLGKGTYGMAYKVILEEAATVVVKRLKELGVGKRGFEEQMQVVGSIKHENVIELRAYYFSKEEKLIVYDYFSHGSVSAMLHGRNGESKRHLDWKTRLRIAIGAARGIARIHEENNGGKQQLVHGNIKSSNIFLNSRQYGCVSDVGISTIMSPLTLPVARSAGYCAPEAMDNRRAAQPPSDVYSFGVVLLELLTGKSPLHATRGGDEIVHLVRWVHSVVREEWTAEVFDGDLLKFPDVQEEMVEMLQIALSCVARVPDQRPQIHQVLKIIENLQHTDMEKRQSFENTTSKPPLPPTQGELLVILDSQDQITIY
ncbi:PREDICTED: probable inactive receptor kinase At4g23740 [Ipomoea nil]|uniref:probable inactive receptor kinase At4g23740 n=1 Tax=Ipomoea nil TaxID=35883 RepID=UPI000900C1CB|nr:PREDICTED: probable inactive receptor kinase At4g23740 [Ipomoea nil]